MAKTLERPITETPPRPPQEVESLTPVVEKVKEPVGREPVASTPNRFIRWMGWMVVVAVVSGTAGLVWWAMATPESELTELEVLHQGELGAEVVPAEAAYNSQTRALLDSMISSSTVEAEFNSQTRALFDGMTSRSAEEAVYNDTTRQLLDWNSQTLDPISRTTRQLLEQNS